MSIQIGNQIRTKNMQVNAINNNETKAVVQFTNPEDLGTKYLMIGENLWIYFPSENDIVKISGHLLKDGMMGSDVSYEDALKSDDLQNKYSITIEGDTTLTEMCYQIVPMVFPEMFPIINVKCQSKKNYSSKAEEKYAKSGNC